MTMKKLRTTFLTAGILAIAALAMVSCSKEESAQAGGLDRTGTISVSVSGLMGEYTQNDDTKAELISNVRVSWKADDKVYAFDGTQCLGELNVSLKDSKDYYALLKGKLLEPAAGTQKITLVYASGYSATKGQTVTDGKLSFDISSQSSGSDSKNTPFVAFGTLDYTEGTPSLEEEIVDFSLATSVMRLNCTGLEASAAITGAKLKGMSNNCVLNVTDAGAELVQGAIGNISLSFADGFKASASGAQVIYAGIAKNGTESAQSLEVNQSKTYEWSFGSKTRDAAKSINAICPVSIAPYVVIPAKYDGETVTDLKWYSQNLAISDSGNKTWKPGGAAVKVPGTDEDVINGDYFQWAAYAGYCGNATDADKGLLIYKSFTSKMTDGSEAEDAFEYKSSEAGMKYYFWPTDSDDYIGIMPYWNKTDEVYEKYADLGLNVELEKSDDVANIILGGNWRMPTQDELTVMLFSTYWAWDANDCGFYIFIPGQGTLGEAGNIGTIADTDDKAKAALFFPAAGAVYQESPSSEIAGSFWSGTRDYGPETVFFTYFQSDGANTFCGMMRSSGLLVRPVSD